MTVFLGNLAIIRPGPSGGEPPPPPAGNYLMDSDGNFILDSDGNKIDVEQF